MRTTEPTAPRVDRRTGRRMPLYAMTDHDEMTGCAAWDQWARDEAATQAMRAAIRDLTARVPMLPGPSGDPPPSPAAAAMAMQVGPAWDEHIAAVRRRSAELAVQRGHIRRYR